MRFHTLDLLRYGSLTGRVLEFSPQARLHIVYGPNEAGKSSALRAMSDLLFGFPDRIENSFLHDASTLRIGATVCARDGTQLSFRRKRGRKNTLLHADDLEKPLAEDALSPFIGTLSRDVFERAFGLNSTRLRDGADAMLKSGGEIGSLLFAAASGLTGLSQLRRQLEADAEAIYAPRRAKERLFYQVLDRHEEARKAERDNELKSGDWKRLVTQQATVQAARDTLQGERQATRQKLVRLRGLLRLAPLLGEIDQELLRQSEYADLATLPVDFAMRLEEALARKAQVDAALQAARSRMETLKGELDAAHVDEALLAAAPLTMARHAEKGAYLKAGEDLARVRAEMEHFDLRLGQDARRLGIGGGVEALERYQPSDADLVRLRKLAEEGRNLQRTGRELRDRMDDETEELHRLDRLETAGRLTDPKPWQEHLAALQPDIAGLEKLDTQIVAVKRAQSELTQAISRISPAITDLDRLLASPLPDAAILSEFRRSLSERQLELRDAEERVKTLVSEETTLRGDLAALKGEGALVTRDDIAAARRKRDVILKKVFTDTADRPAHTDVHAMVVETDRLADTMLEHSARVARHAQLSARLIALDAELGHAGAKSDESARLLQDLRTGFTQLFDACGVEPGEPAHMLEWRHEVDRLARQRENLNDLTDELDRLRLQESRVAAPLLSLADATGLGSATALPATALARALSRHIADIATRWSESRATEGKRQTIVEEIARLEDKDKQHRLSLDRWQTSFAAAATAIGLGPDATLDMADTALGLWKELPHTLEERENRARRVRGMERDIATFEENVLDLAQNIHADWVQLPAAVSVDLLHEAANAAKSMAQRRVTLLENVEQAETDVSRRLEDFHNAEAVLSAIIADLPDETDPATLSQRLQQRRALEAQLDVSRRRFREHAEGEGEESIRLALENFDRVAAELEIEKLEAEDHQQVERFAALTAELSENDRQRRLLEEGTGAETAAFQKQAAQDEARELARQWLVLKLASGLLSTSMETYRQNQADPVLVRAGELFSGLTSGRFSRLLQVYDDKDEPQMVAERQDGRPVPLDGLSEGTGDQLYLALRLAFLEDYCQRNEPAPLILDDIFQTFDDERTACGLTSLASAGTLFQPILFTHHRTVVETAKQHITSGLDVIEL